MPGRQDFFALDRHQEFSDDARKSSRGGGAELPGDFDPVPVVRAQGTDREPGGDGGPAAEFFTVEDDWHVLLTQGCGGIILMVAEHEAESRPVAGGAIGAPVW